MPFGQKLRSGIMSGINWTKKSFPKKHTTMESMPWVSPTRG